MRVAGRGRAGAAQAAPYRPAGVAPAGCRARRAGVRAPSRRYVHQRRRELGEIEAFVPQAHAPGHAAEVDWGQGEVLLGGRCEQVNLFLVRLSHLGAESVAAFGHAPQQAFLEGHVDAFGFFGASRP